MSTQPESANARPTHFLRQIIEADLAAGRVQKVVTRFPPEPNGYLHIGHAKSIYLNFGLAQDYAGVCHLRFDDTNPEKESQEFVDSIVDTVRWLGFEWSESTAAGCVRENLFYASDYFELMHKAAVLLIEAGMAYVDEQTPQQMRSNRGDFSTAGVDSPYRNRTVQQNLERFAQMRAGGLEDGAAVLRAKIDMAHANVNMRDPALYRIRRAHHHNTANAWCIYPMYTFAHPIEDAIEGVTHSICTLEFEDQRPFYDWLLATLATLGMFRPDTDQRLYLPHQYEFARLNLTYVVTSKRKLAQLVAEHHVSGWDDPRMPTLVGLRRRGYTPRALRRFCERIGVSKADSWIDYSVLEGALREDLDPAAARACAILRPLRLRLLNWAQVFGSASHLEGCTAPVHPNFEQRGVRHLTLEPQVWIERSDFEEIAPAGFFRLFPGNKVRLKYGYVIECVGCEKDAQGGITAVLANIVPGTKSGTAGASSVKVKGVITWVGVHSGLDAQVRLYDRLFLQPQPDAGGGDFVQNLNPASLQVLQAKVEPSLAQALPDEKFQFERHGYFCADRLDHRPDHLVFNLSVGLRDGWTKTS